MQNSGAICILTVLGQRVRDDTVASIIYMFCLCIKNANIYVKLFEKWQDLPEANCIKCPNDQ